MDLSTKTINKRISLLHTMKLLSILMVYMIIINLIPSSIIMKLLITIPLTSGYSYVVYRAARGKDFNIVDMFKGYKFCRRTRITFILLELLNIILITVIMITLKQSASTSVVKKIALFIHAVLMYYVSFRFSFIRYFSMNTFELKNKPMAYSEILKRSAQVSKGKFAGYLVLMLVVASVGGLLLNTVGNAFIVNKEFLIVMPMITAIIVRYLEELLRIKILEDSDFKFNYE